MAGFLQREYYLQHPTVNQVLDFLHSLNEIGLGYINIETHRSTLSVILQVPRVTIIGKHTLVTQL